VSRIRKNGGSSGAVTVVQRTSSDLRAPVTAPQPRVIAVPVTSVAHRHSAQLRRTGSYERRDPEGGALFRFCNSAWTHSSSK
jgi:hypothetical protein